MRTARVIIILLVLALLAVILFWGVRYNSTAKPPINIQITPEATNTEVRFNVVFARGFRFGGMSVSTSGRNELFNSGGLFADLEEPQLQETNDSIIPIKGIEIASNSKTQNMLYILRFNQPLKSDKAYRVVVSYYYQGSFEREVCSWVEQHVRVLGRLLPAPRKRLATSEWFMVKPEASGTNMEHHAN
jgi:hypothetical protein